VSCGGKYGILGIAGKAVIGGGTPEAEKLDVGVGKPLVPEVEGMSFVGVAFELLLGTLFIGTIDGAIGAGCGEENIEEAFGLCVGFAVGGT